VSTSSTPEDINAGWAVDGPAQGQWFESTTKTVHVPIPGDRGFGAAVYRWSGSDWRCEGTMRR